MAWIADIMVSSGVWNGICLSNCITIRRNLLSIRTALWSYDMVMLFILLNRSQSVDDHTYIMWSRSMNIDWIIVIMVSSCVWNTIYSSNLISTRRNLLSIRIVLWSYAIVMLSISLIRSRSVDFHAYIICSNLMNIDWTADIMVSSGEPNGICLRNYITIRRNLLSIRTALWSYAMVILFIALNRSQSVDDHTYMMCRSLISID